MSPFRIYMLLAIGIASSLIAAPASAQFDCRQPTSNEWLRQPVNLTNFHDIRPMAIRNLRQNALGLAIERLADVQVIALTDKEVGEIGEASTISDVTIPLGFQPFLVRAVFPVGNPQINLAWSGDVLVVEAFGLGCAAYSKHPIIVYLDRFPSELFVTAMAAL